MANKKPNVVDVMEDDDAATITIVLWSVGVGEYILWFEGKITSEESFRR
jgi:hypothetical protein